MTQSIKTGTGHELVEAPPEWAALSARMTAALDDGLLAKQGRGAQAWAGRDDIVVSITPGAGQGAPACFLPGLARIEIDGSKLEIKPEYFDPSDGLDREDAAATWGLVTHEAAHVRFTTWVDDMEARLREAVAAKSMTPEAAAKIAETAMLLEEPRIETQQKQARPGDERWLRCSAAAHLLDETTGDSSVDTALRTLALVGGRMQAGIITPAEGNKIMVTARKIVNEAPQRVDDHRRYGTDGYMADASAPYGTSRSARMLEVVRSVLVADAAMDADTMIRLAAQWNSYLPEGADQPGQMSKDAREMLDDLKEMTEQIEEGGGWIPEEQDEDNDPVKYKATSWTPATPQQKRAASSLALRLQDYVIPERTTRRAADALPPGRLDVREAMRADAQDARGLIPDAKPWRRLAHRVIPTPPLRVGIAVDVSGSMSGVARHTWEIVFRMYTAFMELPDCEIQVYLAGVGTARAKLRPGQVPTFSYSHGCERVDLALKKLREKLSLTRRGNARLLIIVSDAGFSITEYNGTNKEVATMIKSGCRVLWLDVSHGRGYRGNGDSIAEAQKAGAHYVPITGTPEEAAKIAEDELVRVMQDTAAGIRKGLTR